MVDGWNFEKPSTKAAVAALNAIGVTGNVLVVISRDDENAYKSFRNLQEIQVHPRRGAEYLRRAVQRLDRVYASNPARGTNEQADQPAEPVEAPEAISRRAKNA